jgi:hypothetical protein
MKARSQPGAWGVFMASPIVSAVLTDQLDLNDVSSTLPFYASV